MANSVPLPRGVALTDVFLAVWRHLDPTLGRDALVELDDAQRQRGLPLLFEFSSARVDAETLRASREAEAVRLIWQEDVPFDDPMTQAFMRGVPGIESVFSSARLRLEERMRKILMTWADEVRDGKRELTATHPKTHQRFSPDPTLLENLIGSDRSKSQITTDEGVIRNLRLTVEPEPDPNQPPLPGIFHPSRRPRPKKGTETLRVLTLMKKDGLAAVEAMRYRDRGPRYNAADRTAARALKKLREENSDGSHNE
jgi:hypothetical protein